MIASVLFFWRQQGQMQRATICSFFSCCPVPIHVDQATVFAGAALVLPAGFYPYHCILGPLAVIRSACLMGDFADSLLSSRLYAMLCMHFSIAVCTHDKYSGFTARARSDLPAGQSISSGLLACSASIGLISCVSLI